MYISLCILSLSGSLVFVLLVALSPTFLSSVYDVKRHDESTCKQITITDSPFAVILDVWIVVLNTAEGWKKKKNEGPIGYYSLTRGKGRTVAANNPAKFENVLKRGSSPFVEPREN